MQEFSYARPSTVAEALDLLDEYGDDARLLAGGTDLLIELRNWWIEPKLVIDVKRIEELDCITDRPVVFRIEALS